MSTDYLDDEQVIALYNRVRAGRRTWPDGIWQSPAALQYAVTVFDYWIHNVMGWKGWPEARSRVTPALLEEHRLADIVDDVFVPEFGSDWLDFEIVLNESIRLSEDEVWMPEVLDRQERVEAAFEHSFTELIGSPKQQPRMLSTYHRFRNHLLRMWSAFQEAQAEHDRAEHEAADRFWQGLRMVRLSRAPGAEQWAIFNDDEDRLGEVSIIWRRAPLLPHRPRRRAHLGAGRLGAGRLAARAGDPARGPGGLHLRRLAEGVRRRVLPLRRLRRPAQPVGR